MYTEVNLRLPEASYSAFIFDCDGTLVDSMPIHFKAWREAFTRHRAPFDFDWDLFLRRAGMGLEDTVRELNSEFDCALDPLAVVRDQLTAYSAAISEVRPLGIVVEYAKRMARHHPVAVASGGRREHVEQSLRAVGIRELFPVVVTQEDVHRGKPDPEMFFLAAARMHVAPEACLVIEDSPLGIAAAKAAGMGAALVERR
jgi:HAD superfamily hydrolase (TIGR01509 family)